MKKCQMRGATTNHSQSYGEEEQRSQMTLFHSTPEGRHTYDLTLRYVMLNVASSYAVACRASIQIICMAFNSRLVFG